MVMVMLQLGLWFSHGWAGHDDFDSTCAYRSLFWGEVQEYNIFSPFQHKILFYFIVFYDITSSPFTNLPFIKPFNLCFVWAFRFVVSECVPLQIALNLNWCWKGQIQHMFSLTVTNFIHKDHKTKLWVTWPPPHILTSDKHHFFQRVDRNSKFWPIFTILTRLYKSDQSLGDTWSTKEKRWAEETEAKRHEGQATYVELYLEDTGETKLTF